MTGDAKPWWRSKTLWANALVIVLGGLEAGGVVQAVPAGYEPLFFLVVGMMNGALRVVTKQPVRR